jgi:hypothetical protein
MDTPAIKRVTPDRKYAIKVLSFAKRVLSIASSSRRTSFLDLNLEQSMFHRVCQSLRSDLIFLFLNTTTTQNKRQELLEHTITRGIHITSTAIAREPCLWSKNYGVKDRKMPMISRECKASVTSSR